MTFNDLPLLISLLFGAAQVLFGLAVLAFGARAGRWRRTGVFLLMVLGAWSVCSGASELLVSGMAVVMRTSGTVSSAQVAAIRRAADTALVVVSIVLLVPLAAFSVWKRVQPGGVQPRGGGERKD